MPTEDFKSETEAVRVPSASDSTPPATGTAEPIINLAVRIERLSAAEFTTVCMLKTPKNTVDMKDITQRESFLTAEEMPLLLIKGETLVERLRLKYPPIRGTTPKFESRLTPLAAPKSIAPIEAAVAVLPVAAVMAAKTGTKAVIKVAQAFIALTAVFMAEIIGTIIIPVIARVAA